jgi:hypothetical protein
VDEEERPNKEHIELVDYGEVKLGGVAAALAIIPGLGGVVSASLMNLSGVRAQERVRHVLEELAARIGNLEERSVQYLREGEAIDLFTETLRRAQFESNESKRRLYRNLLHKAIAEPGLESYEEQVRFLRTLEQIQPLHMIVLKEVMRPPSAEEIGPIPPSDQEYVGRPSGSILELRLQGIDRPRIDDIVDQLMNDLRLIQVIDIRSANQLGGDRLLPYGRRFLNFIERPEAGMPES